MKLIELEPQFLKIVEAASGRVYHQVDSVEAADGIVFLCPVCFGNRAERAAKAGRESVDVHSIICWRPRVPPQITPGPGRWEFKGTGYDNLSLDNAPRATSSVWLQGGGCGAHFHITDGEIR